MTDYEALFILNLAGREESLTDVIEGIRTKITELGARVDTVQKMDKRQFARVADKKVPSGHYVNYVFAAGPAVPESIHAAFERNDDVFRILITRKATAAPVTA